MRILSSKYVENPVRVDGYVPSPWPSGKRRPPTGHSNLLSSADYLPTCRTYASHTPVPKWWRGRPWMSKSRIDSGVLVGWRHQKRSGWSGTRDCCGRNTACSTKNRDAIHTLLVVVCVRDLRSDARLPAHVLFVRRAVLYSPRPVRRDARQQQQQQFPLASVGSLCATADAMMMIIVYTT